MFTCLINNIELNFQTDGTVFSPSAVDSGTLAMLSRVSFRPGDKVLDLGCGYGVVGILAAKQIGAERVIMSDVSETAVKYAAINAERNSVVGVDIRLSDGYENIPESDFTLILSNPPYHTDFSVAKRFIETGYKKLLIGGKMVMVTKRLDWYKNKLTTVFGGVTVDTIDGYYVFIAEKRGAVKKNKPPVKTMSKKLRRKYGDSQKL